MQSLLLLHGALGSEKQFKELKESLSSHFRLYSMNFNGHGGKPFLNGSFNIKGFAEEVIAYLAEQQLEKINIVGYSMGGYVAMYLARHYSANINRIITLATKFHWDALVAHKETSLLNPEKIEEKIPSFAASLRESHHPNDWKTLLRETSKMLQDMGNIPPLSDEDYIKINHPVLIMLGDRDQMVGFEETFAVYQRLPNAQLAVLPGSPHALEKIDNTRLAWEINRFIA